jgi:signal peptidase II
LFFGIVAALSLIADISTKVWAELVINQRGFEPVKIIGENVSITLAYNQGGAWGLFSSADEMVRKPFFIGVSGFAVFFIISLYSRLHGSQTALKWGLPLVLGGALGNLSDRITRSQVIDFIDYRADWVMSLNAFIKQYVPTWTLTDHWPTFNVADVAICIGVGLMAVDMFTHRPRSPERGKNAQGDDSLGEEPEKEVPLSDSSLADDDDAASSSGPPADTEQGPSAPASVAS